MIYYDSFEKVNIKWDTAVTIGKFDGLHRGHRALIEEVVGAKKSGLLSVMISFEKPAEKSEEDGSSGKPGYLLTDSEFREKIERSGIDVLIRVPMDRTLMKTDREEFLQRILLEKIRMKKLVTGEDFCFGNNREGNIAYLREQAERFGYSLTVCESVRDDSTVSCGARLPQNAVTSGDLLSGNVIRSSVIRACLLEGRIDRCNKMLGYHYSVSGTVFRDRQLGRTIGYPTANIRPESGKMVPRFGVYATKVTVHGGSFSGVYPGLTNIGVKPTVIDSGNVVAESYLIGFDGDIYGESITVEFLAFIRPEQKFSGLPALAEQMHRDEETALGYFGNGG